MTVRLFFAYAMDPERLWVGAVGLAVPAACGPLMHRHPAMGGIPVDEDCLLDVQGEHDGLVSRPALPPRAGVSAAKLLPGLHG